MAKKLPQDISSLSKDANAVTRKLKEARTKMANCPQCCVEASCSHRTAVKLWIFQVHCSRIFPRTWLSLGFLGPLGFHLFKDLRPLFSELPKALSCIEVAATHQLSIAELLFGSAIWSHFVRFIPCSLISQINLLFKLAESAFWGHVSSC